MSFDAVFDLTAYDKCIVHFHNIAATAALPLFHQKLFSINIFNVMLQMETENLHAVSCILDLQPSKGAGLLSQNLQW